MNGIIVDTGPLVAYLDRSDQDHAWAKDRFMQVTQPLLTCEAVIAESLFLLRRGGINPDGLLNLISRGLVVPEFSLAAEIQAIQHLMRTYRNIPMSLADACLVRMSEIHERSVVMTLDSDFVVYRKSRRKVIPLLKPER
ncbi:MAG: PIN domain-containing protein [Luteolibacter sp.]|uniref:type II toxin-antitoxin system VapC family toxin n=1 Tax=Luteolibacter sp. TaxID=1962973 RepID=UPI003265F92C